MTDSVDYIYPGSVLICFALLSTINNFYLWLTGKTVESGLCQTLTIRISPNFVFPLEAVAKVILCLVGVIIELLTFSNDNKFFRSQDTQEMTMYCFYMFAAFYECACVTSSKLEKRVTLLGYAIAAGAEAYLTYHFQSDREDGCILMCWSAIATVQALVFLAQSVGFNNAPVLIIRNVALLCHGTWFWHIAFSDYLYEHEEKHSDETRDLNSTDYEEVKVSAVASAFSIHVLFDYMLVMFMYMGMSLVLSNTSSATVDRNATRPLIDEENETDSDMENFELSQPPSGVPPPAGEGSPTKKIDTKSVSEPRLGL